MSRLRNQTLLDIDRVLKNHLSYTYEVKNHTDGNPFLSICVAEKPAFQFCVSHTEASGEFQTLESPGQFLTVDEKCLRPNFQLVLQALNQWAARTEIELTKGQIIDHPATSKTSVTLKDRSINHDYRLDLLNTDSILQSYIVDISQ